MIDRILRWYLARYLRDVKHRSEVRAMMHEITQREAESGLPSEQEPV
jgi:hypothetical protein